jgi:hypothetical protein
VVDVVGESRKVFATKQDGDAEEEHSGDDMPDRPNLSSLPSPYQHEEALASDIFSSLENYRDTFAKCNGLGLEKVLSFDEMAQIARRVVAQPTRAPSAKSMAPAHLTRCSSTCFAE